MSIKQEMWAYVAETDAAKKRAMESNQRLIHAQQFGTNEDEVIARAECIAAGGYVLETRTLVA